MKKTFALLAVALLVGCGEWRLYPHEDDPEEDDYGRGSYGSDDHESAPASSSSAPAMLPPASSDAGVDDRLRCEGFATFCSDLDLSFCAQQKGCATAGDQCIGAASPCSFQATEASCERQLGCSWAPR